MDFIKNIGTGKLLVGLTVIVSVAVLALLVLSRGDEPTVRERQVLEIAELIGLDKEKFLQDYRSEDVRNTVAADLAEADARQERLGTPSFFFNGEQIQVPSSYEDLKNKIETAITTLGEDEILLIEEFFDYRCPFCAISFPYTYQAKVEFGEKIQVKHRFSPLTSLAGHQDAESWAWAAQAARLQGKFFEYSKATFEKLHANLDFAAIEGLSSEITAE